MTTEKGMHESTQTVSPQYGYDSPSADFRTLCQKAGVLPTRRQARKFGQGRGIAWTWRGGRTGLTFRKVEAA